MCEDCYLTGGPGQCAQQYLCDGPFHERPAGNTGPVYFVEVVVWVVHVFCVHGSPYVLSVRKRRRSQQYTKNKLCSFSEKQPRGATKWTAKQRQHPNSERDPLDAVLIRPNSLLLTPYDEKGNTKNGNTFNPFTHFQISPAASPEI